MRDPNRIYKYCHELAEIWGKVPDWRLGQFMTNMMRAWAWGGHGDPFYAEDEEFLTFIKDYFKENKDA